MVIYKRGRGFEQETTVKQIQVVVEAGCIPYTRMHCVVIRSRGPFNFSKAPETFRARKDIFSSSVSKKREAYTLETSCTKGTSVYINNMWNKTTL